MKLILLYLLILLPFVNISSQCDSILLLSQSDINNFIKNHGKCETINYLIIKDNLKDIYNFDSLSSIQRVNNRLEIWLKNELNKNVFGFRNLKIVNELSLVDLNSEDSFAALDTISRLDFGSSAGNLKSIIPLKNIKHIKNRLNLSARCDNKETPYFTTGPDFFLTLSGLMDSNSVKVLASRIKNENLKGLSIFPGSGFELKNIPNIDSVKNLSFGFCNNSDFSTISKLKNVEYFSLLNDLGNNKYGDGFTFINKLNGLDLQNNKSNIDLKRLLPDLRTIDVNLNMFNNDSIFDLKFLENATPPRSPYLGLYKVSIQNNKRLKDCNVTFLCDALKMYPDSVLINGNGGKCTKDEILAYCKRVNTEQYNDVDIFVYPNPAFDDLSVTGIEGQFKYKVLGINGNAVITGITSGIIPIVDLPSGMYILEITMGDFKKTINKRIIKI